MAFTLTYDLDVRMRPKFFSSLCNCRAENIYLQQFSNYRADRHTHQMTHMCMISVCMGSATEAVGDNVPHFWDQWGIGGYRGAVQ